MRQRGLSVRSWMTRTACVAGAFLGAGLLSPAVADAQLEYDLRISDGISPASDSWAVAAPGNLTIELWARVTGTDNVHTNDAFHSGYVVLQSNEINGGVVNTGGLAAPGGETRVAPFNDFSSSRTGTGSDLNSDGIGDWGSTAADGTDTNYMFARSNAPTYGGGSVGNAVSANAWEFQVGQWTLQINSLIGSPSSGAETRIEVMQPAWTSGGAAFAIFYGDDPNPSAPGGQTSVNSGNASGVYGDFVTITVPEPASLAGVALGALGLLSRRRAAK